MVAPPEAEPAVAMAAARSRSGVLHTLSTGTFESVEDSAPLVVMSPVLSSAAVMDRDGCNCLGPVISHTKQTPGESY